MTEPVYSSSSSASASASSSSCDGGMTIDIRPMIEDVSQVMTKHITNILSGVIGEYTVYKETHDTIMGLPCVRRLQERVVALESRSTTSNEEIPNIESYRSTTTNTAVTSREDEIAQLQSAIVELNRYIIALESKVDMKTMRSSSQAVQNIEEESVRLEIHEEDDSDTDANAADEEDDNTFVKDTTNKNVIIVAANLEEDTDAQTENTEELAADEEEEEAVEEEEEEAAEEEEEEVAEEEAVEEEEEVAEEEEAVEDEEEAAEEEAVEEEAVEEEEAAEEEAAEEEEAEEEEAVEEEEAAEEEEEATEEEDVAEEEAEIEVSEVKIKGKTYFTTDTQNGIIYACVNDDVGDEVGVFKNGVAVFNKGKK